MKTLKSKLLLILSGLFLLITVINYAIQELIVLPGFLELELNEAGKDMQRVQQAIERELYHLDNQCWDWASWDDTYEFVETNNNDYIKSNLLLSSFVDNGINLICIFDAKSREIWSKLIDIVNETEIAFEDLPENLTKELFIIANRTKSIEALKEVKAVGILKTSAGYLLISARPILTSDSEGPPKGVFVMGKFLDSTLVETLSEQTEVQFTISPGNSLPEYANKKALQTYVIDKNVFKFDRNSPDSLIVYATERDIYGDPVLTLHAHINRQIYKSGQVTKNYAVFSSIVTLFGIILVLLVLFHKIILNGIRQLTQHVLSVARTGNLTSRLSFKRADEIGTLAREFDKMLDGLKSRSDELYKKNQQLLLSIEERDRADKALHDAEEKLERLKKMEVIGTLASGVAHDLNNILSGVVSYPELILTDERLHPQLRESIEVIKDSGQKAAAVVADLLTIARGVAIDKTVVNLNEVVKEYFASPEFKHIQTQNPGINFQLDLSPEPPLTIGSKIHLRKVLMNLVLNAAEAVNENGEVIVITKRQMLNEILEGVGKVKPGPYALLVVCNDGNGIPPKHLDRIFEPFYTTKVMGQSGSGLGLSVVWNTVANHDGYINVSSNQNGTAFEIYFPLTDQEVTTESLPTVSLPVGSGEHVMVVDDSPNQRRITCRILEKLGYKTVSVASGNEAIASLRQQSFDLIVLDMIMGEGINGFETYREILKIRENQKAIITSGFSETEDVKAAQKLGAGEFIKKPFTMQRIAIAIRNELQR